MLNSEEMQFAIDDARTRHAAVVDLICFTDQQAAVILRLYVTLGLASVSGAIAVNTFSAPIIWALIGAGMTFFVGALFCLKAMATASINLPGRGAEFWRWATHPKITIDDVYYEYLVNLENKRDLNNEVNRRTARALKRAKLCGAYAPLVALLFGAISMAIMLLL